MLQCKCCKEVGHSIENCTRDPNLVTKNDAEREMVRLSLLKDNKKLHADSVVQTTQFIQKAVMVPISVDEDGKSSEPSNLKHPFMRGIMNFDDYNYSSINDYVFITEG